MRLRLICMLYQLHSCFVQFISTPSLFDHAGWLAAAGGGCLRHELGTSFAVRVATPPAWDIEHSLNPAYCASGGNPSRMRLIQKCRCRTLKLR